MRGAGLPGSVPDTPPPPQSQQSSLRATSAAHGGGSVASSSMRSTMGASGGSHLISKVVPGMKGRWVGESDVVRDLHKRIYQAKDPATRERLMDELREANGLQAAAQSVKDEDQRKHKKREGEAKERERARIMDMYRQDSSKPSGRVQAKAMLDASKGEVLVGQNERLHQIYHGARNVYVTPPGTPARDEAERVANRRKAALANADTFLGPDAAAAAPPPGDKPSSKYADADKAAAPKAVEVQEDDSDDDGGDEEYEFFQVNAQKQFSNAIRLIFLGMLSASVLVAAIALQQVTDQCTGAGKPAVRRVLYRNFSSVNVRKILVRKNKGALRVKMEDLGWANGTCHCVPGYPGEYCTGMRTPGRGGCPFPEDDGGWRCKGACPFPPCSQNFKLPNCTDTIINVTVTHMARTADALFGVESNVTQVDGVLEVSSNWVDGHDTVLNCPQADVEISLPASISNGVVRYKVVWDKDQDKYLEPQALYARNVIESMELLVEARRMEAHSWMLPRRGLIDVDVADVSFRNITLRSNIGAVKVRGVDSALLDVISYGSNVHLDTINVAAVKIRMLAYYWYQMVWPALYRHVGNAYMHAVDGVPKHLAAVGVQPNVGPGQLFGNLSLLSDNGEVFLSDVSRMNINVSIEQEGEQPPKELFDEPNGVPPPISGNVTLVMRAVNSQGGMLLEAPEGAVSLYADDSSQTNVWGSTGDLNECAGDTRTRAQWLQTSPTDCVYWGMFGSKGVKLAAGGKTVWTTLGPRIVDAQVGNTGMKQTIKVWTKGGYIRSNFSVGGFTRCPVNVVNGTCSNHGDCQADGTCKCHGGYTLADCSYKSCPGDAPGVSCSGRGKCDGQGSCTCMPSFHAADCANITCPANSPMNNCGRCTLARTGACKLVSFIASVYTLEMYIKPSSADRRRLIAAVPRDPVAIMRDISANTGIPTKLCTVPVKKSKGECVADLKVIAAPGRPNVTKVTFSALAELPMSRLYKKQLSYTPCRNVTKRINLILQTFKECDYPTYGSQRLMSMSVSLSCPASCNGRGVVTKQSSIGCDTATGRCACRSAYFRNDCGLYRCLNDCSGRGSCDPSEIYKGYGRCTCQQYMHTSIGAVSSSNSTNASTSGSTTGANGTNSTAASLVAYGGLGCERVDCEQNCTSRTFEGKPLGECDGFTGKCRCINRGAGELCNRLTCPGNCSWAMPVKVQNDSMCTDFALYTDDLGKYCQFYIDAKRNNVSKCGAYADSVTPMVIRESYKLNGVQVPGYPDVSPNNACCACGGGIKGFKITLTPQKQGGDCNTDTGVCTCPHDARQRPWLSDCTGFLCGGWNQTTVPQVAWAKVDMKQLLWNEVNFPSDSGSRLVRLKRGNATCSGRGECYAPNATCACFGGYSGSHCQTPPAKGGATPPPSPPPAPGSPAPTPGQTPAPSPGSSSPAANALVAPADAMSGTCNFTSRACSVCSNSEQCSSLANWTSAASNATIGGYCSSGAACSTCGNASDVCAPKLGTRLPCNTTLQSSGLLLANGTVSLHNASFVNGTWRYLLNDTWATEPPCRKAAAPAPAPAPKPGKRRLEDDGAVLRLKTDEEMDAVLPGAKPSFGEDPTAVVAPILASPLVVWLLTAFGAALGVEFLLGNDADTSALRFLATSCWAVAFGPQLSVTLFSLRRVTREDGQLKTLNIDSAKISANANARLRRWHAFLLVFSCWSMFGGVRGS